MTYQAAEHHFADLPGVRTGHFNAIAGLDTFGDVRSLFVIGRPLPDPRDIRSMALALTGRPIALEDARQETRGVLMADGTGAGINVRAYADPDLEALRVAITDSEVVQAIRRGRAINRTAETPLDVYIMADVVIPLSVNRVVRWEDVQLDVVGRMAARGAVLSSPSDAAKAYPDLFLSPEAAKKALQRQAPGGADFGDISLWNTNHRGMSPKYPVQISYRPSGRGQQTRTALSAAFRLDGFRDWLEALLGPLTVYEELPPPDEPEPPPADVDDPSWTPDQEACAELELAVPKNHNRLHAHASAEPWATCPGLLASAGPAPPR